MTVFLGLVDGKIYHTYSKRLRDKYFGKNYVVVFSLGKGRSGGVKIRGSEPLSVLEGKMERTDAYIEDGYGNRTYLWIEKKKGKKDKPKKRRRKNGKNTTKEGHSRAARSSNTQKM